MDNGVQGYFSLTDMSSKIFSAINTEGNFAMGIYSVLSVVLGKGGNKRLPCLATEREAITHYFRRGCRYESIRFCYWLSNMACPMSLKTLKRHLSEYELQKRNHSVSDHSVREIIQNEIHWPQSFQLLTAVSIILY